jgi:superfamily II DNA or RNA helicase
VPKNPKYKLFYYAVIYTDRFCNTLDTKSNSGVNSAPAISFLKFPFTLAKDQIDAVNAWMAKDCRGSIIYSTGTGKTEIAFECAKQACETRFRKRNDDWSYIRYDPFNILFLVPRIVLVQQNIHRLVNYCIPRDKLGVYFGECKDIREITISTYQSAINNHDLIACSDMIIFDEVHLVSDSASTLRTIFDTVVDSNSKRPLLGLTATIDESDPKYKTILSLLPPVKKYLIKEAVKDKRLAAPFMIPIKVELTPSEKKIYDECTTKIRNISMYLNTSDPKSISTMLRRGRHLAGLARAWFANVKRRKSLINCATNKLAAAEDIISTRHPSERIMVFSETIESIQMLKGLLEDNGIKTMVIDSKSRLKDRQEKLAMWGTEFFPLLSVHTLEIGYDVPEVRVAIILATSSNINQITQRIGRILRKTEQKDTALIYTIYLSETRDASTLKMVRQATNIDTMQYRNRDYKTRKARLSRNTNLDRFY